MKKIVILLAAGLLIGVYANAAETPVNSITATENAVVANVEAAADTAVENAENATFTDVDVDYVVDENSWEYKKDKVVKALMDIDIKIKEAETKKDFKEVNRLETEKGKLIKDLDKANVELTKERAEMAAKESKEKAKTEVETVVEVEIVTEAETNAEAAEKSVPEKAAE